MLQHYHEAIIEHAKLSGSQIHSMKKQFSDAVTRTDNEMKHMHNQIVDQAEEIRQLKGKVAELQSIKDGQSSKVIIVFNFTYNQFNPI